MGRLQAEDMVETGKEFGFPMETMLYNHMRYNCYPSVSEFIDVALAAIELANQGEWNATINIAEIMGKDVFNKAAPVCKIIEGWNLQDFVESEIDEGNELYEESQCNI